MAARHPSESNPRSDAPDPGAGDHYRVAFDNSREAIVIAQDDVLKVANVAAARLSGYPVEQLLGRPFSDIVHPEDLAKTHEIYLHRIEGEVSDRSHVLRIVRASGEVAWLEAHSMPTEWAGKPAVLTFLNDVTDREGARR